MKYDQQQSILVSFIQDDWDSVFSSFQDKTVLASSLDIKKNSNSGNTIVFSST